MEGKETVRNASSSVRSMKEEHDSNVIRAIVDNTGEREESLKVWIDEKIKKSVHGAEYGLLLPIEKDEDEEKLRFIELN